MKLSYTFDDGGRQAAGFTGTAGDCVVRAIAIVAGLPYAAVYRDISERQRAQRVTKRTRKGARSVRNGTYVKRKWFKDYMAALGFEFVPTMGIGTGCRVHLADGELPAGRLIVSVSKHYTAVINGQIRDTFDPRRDFVETGAKDGEPYRRNVSRCVYGYWKPKAPPVPREFTACEGYRGFAIAVQHGRYSIWNEAGNCVGGHASTRAEARRMVDTQLADRVPA